MDSFSSFPTTPNSPAHSATMVVPSDTAALPQVSRALYVGQGGDLSVVMAGGETVTFEAVVSGSLLPIRVSRVNAAGTTAAGVLALW